MPLNKETKPNQMKVDQEPPTTSGMKMYITSNTEESSVELSWAAATWSPMKAIRYLWFNNQWLLLLIVIIIYAANNDKT